MKTKLILLALVSVFSLQPSALLHAATTIDPANHYAYGANFGWLDWRGDTANGAWNLGVNCNGGSDSLSQFGSYACPNNQVTLNIANNSAVTNFVIQLCSGIAISPASPLPVGEVGIVYNQSLQALDCSGIYNWSQPGGTLSGNLGLYSGGQFYNSPAIPTPAASPPSLLKSMTGAAIQPTGNIRWLSAMPCKSPQPLCPTARMA